MPKGFGAELIAALGRPLAAPSANASGRVSATTAAAVEADLGARIPLIVDGGPTPVGLESTIVKVEGNAVRLLRPGGVAAEDIERVLGRALLRGGAVGVEAPGMLASHYAPGAAVRVDAPRCQARRGAARLRAGNASPDQGTPSPSSTCRRQAISRKRRPISSRWSRRSIAAARRRSPSCPFRKPVSARRSTTGSAVLPRRVTCRSIRLRHADGYRSQRTRPCFDRRALPKSSAHATR